tara:strand:- start:2216 stop:2740 length:525 start_codon:yes stop_codon:yes gene_type:complete
MKLPKLIITDIDGVWTSGGMYYDQSGNEWKKFNTSDSAGVLFAKSMKIPVAIITGEDTDIVARRAKKLKIDYLYQGISNKTKIANTICDELNIDLSETAFIGDDIGDIALLQKVGFSGAPYNASEYVKSEVEYVTKKNGGQGAFREFVEEIINRSDEHSLSSIIDVLVNNSLNS